MDQQGGLQNAGIEFQHAIELLFSNARNIKESSICRSVINNPWKWHDHSQFPDSSSYCEFTNIYEHRLSSARGDTERMINIKRCIFIGKYEELALNIWFYKIFKALKYHTRNKWYSNKLEATIKNKTKL